MQRTTRARLSSRMLLDLDFSDFDSDRRFTDQHLAKNHANLDSQYKLLHKPVKPALTISASHDFAHHQNCLLENTMFRLLKALPLALALAALSFFPASCGSSSKSQVRVLHAISDGPALDINVNTTKVFTNIAFSGVQ